MQKSIEEFGDMSCTTAFDEIGTQFVGTLKYRTFEVGQIFGADLASVRAQFQAICDLVETGGMVRHGIIMTGYHNRAFKGDVLLVDGEVFGEWNSDEEEWCHFTAHGDSEITCSAPSPWLLHDSISDWLVSRNGTPPDKRQYGVT
jgi:hypothetical protein